MVFLGRIIPQNGVIGNLPSRDPELLIKHDQGVNFRFGRHRSCSRRMAPARPLRIANAGYEPLCLIARVTTGSPHLPTLQTCHQPRCKKLIPISMRVLRLAAIVKVLACCERTTAACSLLFCIWTWPKIRRSAAVLTTSKAIKGGVPMKPVWREG
jgi:hypothetical protein